MNLSQLYTILGWPLRFWKTRTLPPQPVAHDLPFDEAVRIASRRIDTAAEADPQKKMADEEFREKCREMDARYTSLKQGESLGKLTPSERGELVCMETGHGRAWPSSTSVRRNALDGAVHYLLHKNA